MLQRHDQKMVQQYKLPHRLIVLRLNNLKKNAHTTVAKTHPVKHPATIPKKAVAKNGTALTITAIKTPIAAGEK
jgi:hypothetical protein